MLFEEALDLSRDLDNPTLALLYLTGMAGIATLRSRARPPAGQSGDRLRAARLFGAVDHLHRELGAAMWQAFRSTFDELLAAARSQVEAKAWDAAFREGSAMNLEQAVAYAAETVGGL